MWGFKMLLLKFLPWILVTLLSAALNHIWNTNIRTTQQMYVPQSCCKCHDTSWGEGFGKEMLFHLSNN